MKRVHFYVGIGTNERDEVMEYDDDVTEEEINSDFDIWMGDHVNSNWWIEDEERVSEQQIREQKAFAAATGGMDYRI